MAPNGHAPSEAGTTDRSTHDAPPSTWLKKHGNMEFMAWQKEHPGEALSFEDWRKSRHTGIDGLSLYYAALQIWEESESSEGEDDQLKVESRPRGVRGQSAREPKKTLKTNGTGLARSAGSATPSSMAQAKDLSPSTKKKRKARRKYLSQEIVASEESDDAGTATPITEATTPSAPIVTVNGRRKSSNRKPRKKPISEETISPADEEDDPMVMNDIRTPAIASPLPVRSAPKVPIAVQASEPHKKIVLNTKKALKKKVLSEETVLDDDTDEGAATIVPSTATAVTEPNVTATTESQTPTAARTLSNTNEATASPDPTSESASATRRGLRTRRPAQQRPYLYDAQIYEDHDDDEPEEEEEEEEEQALIQPSPEVQSRRVSIASLGQNHAGDKPEQLDEETLAILQGEVDPEPLDSYGRPKHFKGKGRAWKKEESDEDLEFNPSKKKAARAKAKAKALAQQQSLQPKKRGRPRKTVLSEDVVRDDSDDNATARTEKASPSLPVWEAPVKRARKPPRKSTLSEAIVRDDSNEEEEKAKSDKATSNNTTLDILTPGTPVPKKRGRPRKSDQSVEAKTPATLGEKKDEEVSDTAKGTPNDSNTPKSELKSYTPEGEPQRPSLTVDDIMSEDMDLGGSSQDESEMESVKRSQTSRDDIEAHMADVNADDDDDDDDDNQESCK